MKYEDMSDWEITRRVVEIRCQGQLIKFLPQEDILEPMTSGVMSDKLKIITESGREQVIDVCNNPSDAWPIIVENKISISHSIALYRADALVYNSKFDNGFKIFKQDSQLGDTSSRGALRAAMICFLKMKDAE